MEDIANPFTVSEHAKQQKQAPTMDEKERQLHMERIRQKIEQEMEKKRQEQILKDAEEAKRQIEIEKIRQDHRQREVQKQMEYMNLVNRQERQQRKVRKAVQAATPKSKVDWQEYDHGKARQMFDDNVLQGTREQEGLEEMLE